MSDYYWLLVEGLVLTVQLSVVALVGGSLLGLLLGLAATSSYRVLRTIVGVYVGTVRAIPLIVLLFLGYYGLPIQFGIHTSTMVAAAIVLSLFSGAYMTQVVRAGIEAVPAGQWEASHAIGFGYIRTMRSVVLPQALRIMIPAAVGVLVFTIKDSSIASIIGVQEVTQAGLNIRNITLDSWGPLGAVAATYLVLCTVISILGGTLERRLARQLRREAA